MPEGSSYVVSAKQFNFPPPLPPVSPQLQPQNRVLIPNNRFTQGVATNFALLGTTDMLPGNTPSGTVMLTFSPTLRNLLNSIRLDGTITTVTGNFNFFVSDEGNNAAYQRGLRNVQTQLTRLFRNVGVRNVRISVQSTNQQGNQQGTVQLSWG